MVGWFAVAFLIRKISLSCASNNPGSVDFADFLVAWIAFLGVVGHLPTALVFPFYKMKEFLEWKFGGKERAI